MLINNLDIPNVIRIKHIYHRKKSQLWVTKMSLLFPRYQTFSPAVIKSLSLLEIRKILIQTSNALKNIHKIGIFHGDIKTANLVYDSPNQEVFIIDFGSAELLYPHMKHHYRCGTEDIERRK